MRRRSSFAVLLAASLVTLTPLTSQAVGHDVAHEPSTTAESGPIDTSSRASVREAYRRFWVRGEESRPRWIGGSVEDCSPGRLADGSTRRQLDAINFARRMAGLDPVVLDTKVVPSAQAAALIMTANHAVSHDPPREWPCWTRTGRDAASQSNLYEGTPRESNSDKIEAYLDDWGGGNHRVGHRRWLLYPDLRSVGIAGTERANVTYLFGSPFDEAAPDPQWVPWPTAGWFPSRLDPRGRWSLGSGADDTDFSDARVSVTYRGEPVSGIRLRTPDVAPGKPTLVWEMPARAWPSRPVGAAEVTVSGIVVDGVPGQVAAYTIRFFRTR
ncbi:CAP domain-containing protein [Nocardioides sp. Soil805]|uniref:CAP domain-containing protein n=1 Tax=Nocardioides sp. Soil805 TaxID=1736416 RepID=UPI0007032F8B|nr:CAP domain-containing protein [Nocardioides sp. Soil805]KRF36980.1 hypothetical protein ASG94_06205 [Nocardioides sp. Soil805]